MTLESGRAAAAEPVDAVLADGAGRARGGRALVHVALAQRPLEPGQTGAQEVVPHCRALKQELSRSRSLEKFFAQVSLLVVSTPEDMRVWRFKEAGFFSL